MAYYNNIDNNYVKFIKGKLSVFNQLPDNQKFDNTLYFLTDEEGHLNLYLGAQPIISGEIETEKLNLTELLDVSLGDKIEDGNILAYINGEWTNVNLETLSEWLDIPVTMEGATKDKEGKSGLVPVPTAGQQDFFLQGSGNWVNIVEVIKPTIQTEANTIVTKAVGDLVNGAPETLDTLKEISDWILDDKTGAAALVKEFGDFKTQVGDLSSLSENQTLVGLVAANAQTIETTQSNLNNLVTKVGDLSALGENQTLTGLITTTQNNLSTLTTKVGDLEASVGVLEDLLIDSEGGTIDLSSYVTKDTFATTVGNLEDINNIKLSNLKTEEKNSLIGAINELHDQFVWGEITINS